MGSVENPYGSLAEVEAEASCEKIIGLWSETALDGGILLKPGQSLEGKHGPKGAYPVITNSSAALNNGAGVSLTSDNSIKHLHIKDTWYAGVGGQISGKLSIHKARVTGAGQVGEPSGVNGITSAWPNVFIAIVADSDISIKDSEFGGSDGSGIMIYPLNGHSKIEMDKVDVKDVGDLTGDGWTWTPGIGVQMLNMASVDITIKNSSVENIGRGYSNSDGLALLNYGGGDLVAKVDGYSYQNPSGVGGGSATGIEIGLIHGLQGSFTATVSNSIIEDSNSCGIQVVDLASYGGNTLDVTLEGNLVVNNVMGVCAWQDETILSDFSLGMRDNAIFDSTYFGVWLEIWGPISTYNALLEGNTIANSGDIGLYVERYQNSTGSYNIDAGLGALGSAGENRIIGSGVDDVFSWNMDVTAANKWWGRETGPSSIQALEGHSGT